MGHAHPEFSGVAVDSDAKAARLRRFVDSAGAADAELVALWRQRSAAEHARAGAHLSDMAAQVAAQTRSAADRDEMFPGLSSFQRTPPRE